MHVSPAAFDREFAEFRALIRKHVDGEEFTTFQEGFAADWEGYKENVRNEALERLQMATWDASKVGTGDILKRVINAIEINENPDTLRNNLVAWQNRYGHKNRAHAALLDAQNNARSKEKFEEWFLDFAQDRCTDEELFETFRELAGSRYDLLAYLFFLKDWTRFMPIATTTFDDAFRLLEIGLITRQRCSWENYADYNEALRAVQRHLIDRAGLRGARLIDAHSFCWIRVRLGNIPK